ncbi:MAG: hypothetical protein GY862_05760 [Gammaproteobacteria bacterium]|nr:hypothetical protein [Gammaproteobacteria bacterium]
MSAPFVFSWRLTEMLSILALFLYTYNFYFFPPMQTRPLDALQHARSQRLTRGVMPLGGTEASAFVQVLTG